MRQIFEFGIARNGVAGVFLLDVGPDFDVCAESFSQAQNFGCRRIHHAFVGDMGIGECLGANELCAGASRQSHGFAVGTCQDLNPNGQAKSRREAVDGDGHRRNDFGTYMPIEIGQICHVFDEERITSALDEVLGVAHGVLQYLIDR